MGESPVTRWSLIGKVLQGGEPDREDFARLYEPVIRAYLKARWRGSTLYQEIDDAVQEVFLACFREGGALSHFVPRRPGGFRAYLYSVTRHIALHLERSRRRRRDAPGPFAFDPDIREGDDDRLSSEFDRSWALSILREALERQAELARERGPAATRRLEILRLRFSDGLPIRDVAKLWGVNARKLHREYAKARDEYREALIEVVAWHNPGARAEVEAECSRLLDYLD